MTKRQIVRFVVGLTRARSYRRKRDEFIRETNDLGARNFEPCIVRVNVNEKNERANTFRRYDE